MESRPIFVTLLAVFLGVAVRSVSTQTSVAAVPCIDTMDCTDVRLPMHARCQSGFCICPNENGAPINCTIHEVQPKSAGRNNPVVSRSCKMTKDCNLPNGYCNVTRSQCACSDGFVMATQDWNCLPIAHSLGSSCEVDQQCQARMGNTSCTESQCVCKPGYHLNGNSTCWKTLGFGEHCTNDEECSHIDNADCESSQCGCSKKAILSSDGQRCLPIATKINEACVERLQCTRRFDDSDCINERCQCTSNNHFEKSSYECVSTRNLGEKCHTDDECYQHEEEGAIRAQRCVDHICVCNENFVKSDDECVMSAASSFSLVSGLVLTVFPAILMLSRS